MDSYFGFHDGTWINAHPYHLVIVIIFEDQHYKQFRLKSEQLAVIIVFNKMETKTI